GAYGVALGVMYFGQRKLMYRPPETTVRSPERAGFQQARTIRIKTKDGEQIVTWFVPPAEGKPIVMFFHGNGEILAWRVKRFEALTANGLGLLAVSYRGYAGSTGSPTEEGLINDSEAAYSYLATRFPKEKIAIWGYSLGSGVAVRLAAQHQIAKL